MKEIWGQCFDVKTALLPWATGSFSNSNLSNSAVPWFGELFWHVTHMLPIETKPVTRGNDVKPKPCHQTSPVPYSTENRSTWSTRLIFLYLLCRWSPSHWQRKETNPISRLPKTVMSVMFTWVVLARFVRMSKENRQAGFFCGEHILWLNLRAGPCKVRVTLEMAKNIPTSNFSAERYLWVLKHRQPKAT